MFTSIYATGFRSISDTSDVTLSTLAHVNVLVGPNNSGKSNIPRLLQWFQAGCAAIAGNLRQAGGSTVSEVTYCLGVEAPANDQDRWRYAAEIVARVTLDISFLPEVIDAVRKAIGADTVVVEFRARPIQPSTATFSLMPFFEGRELYKSENGKVSVWSPDHSGYHPIEQAKGRAKTLALLGPLLAKALAQARPDDVSAPILYIDPVRHALRASAPGSTGVDGGRLIELMEHLRQENRARYNDVVARLTHWLQEFLGESERPNLTFRTPSNGKPAEIEVGVNRGGEPMTASLSQFGTGISEAIIVCGSCLLEGGKRPRCIVVEEPEAHLHPGAARRLVEILASLPNTQLFVTSHSAALLDATTSDWTIHRIRLRESGSSLAELLFPVALTPDRALAVIDDLGVRPSQLFLANITLWIEGASDAHYLRAHFRSFRPRWIEGRDFAFVIYGGNSGHALTFGGADDAKVVSLFSVSSKPFVIADTDSSGTSPKKAWVQQLLADPKFGTQVLVTRGREIENMVEPSLLNAAVAQVCNPLKEGKFSLPVTVSVPTGSSFDEFLPLHATINGKSLADPAVLGRKIVAEKVAIARHVALAAAGRSPFMTSAQSLFSPLP